MRRLVLCLLLVGCVNAPLFVETPFRRWAEEIEVCAGVHRNVSDVRWIIVASRKELDGFCGPGAAGCYRTRPERIYLLAELLDEQLVKHEWMHALGFHHGDDMYDTCLGGWR